MRPKESGRFFLVFVGVGAIAVDRGTQALGHVGVSLCFGFAVCAMVYATGHISGAHLNPAVTFAFRVTGRCPRGDALPYVAAQVFGALAAAVLLRVTIELPTGTGTTIPQIPLASAWVTEFVLTFALMFVIAAVATDPRAHGTTAGLAIGIAVAMGALVGGPLTGGSMNPARSLGPAIVTGVFRSHWVYWTAPVVGAISGALAYEVVRSGGVAAKQR